MSRRLPPTVSGINPLDPEDHAGWGRSPEGQALLQTVLAGCREGDTGPARLRASEMDTRQRAVDRSDPPPRPQPRNAGLRARASRRAIAALAAVVVLAAAVYGAYALHDALRVDQPVLVVNDPAGTQPTATSIAGSTVPKPFDAQGVWAGNVKTVPDSPASLPPEFFQEPTQPAEFIIGEPLWIFATELGMEEVVAAVAAAPADQPIFTFDPSEELCQALDVHERTRPGFFGALPEMFTQSPVLCREQAFPEVGPVWTLAWAQLNGENGPSESTLDPSSVYAAAVILTTLTEESRRGLEANQRAQESDGTSTTATTDPYPIQQTLESEAAAALALRAAQYLEDVTGMRLDIEDAKETRMIGPNQTVQHLAHGATLHERGTGRRLAYHVFWSDEGQMGTSGGGVSGAPTAWFRADDGSFGYIYAAKFGYYCRLQLRNGVTAFAEASGPLRAPVQPPAESSVLSAEELVSFVRWLAGEGEHLKP